MTGPEQLWQRTAGDLAAGYAAGAVSPVEATRSCLGRIADADPAINAFCLLDAESALAQAQAAEQRWRAGTPLGPLDGVPVAVKDLVLTQGWPTRRGSQLLRDDDRGSAATDAPVVARLRAAGAVIVGKTTTPEFGWKAVTDSPLTGTTVNPWDTTLTAGGSSGGSAAAVAAGMVPLAIGTDGGGSIRIPSAFCGVVGLKPSHGRVPQSPPSPFGVLSHLGPHARTADDALLLLRTIAGASNADPFTAGIGALHDGGDDVELAGLRIAFSPTLGFATVDAEIAGLVADAVSLLEQRGARVAVVDSVMSDPIEWFETLWYSGAARTIAAYSPIPPDVTVDPGLLEFARRGAQRSAVDYVRALEGRAALASSVEDFLGDYDVLATPAMPIAAFAAGGDTPPGWPSDTWMSWTPFTYPFNLTGHPAVSVPCGLTQQGRPVGLQLVGRRFDDLRVMAVAAQFGAVAPASMPW